LAQEEALKMVSARRIMIDLHFYGRGYLRNKFGLSLAIIFPVMLILIFGAIFSGGYFSGRSSGPMTVYVQNQDSGQISNSFMDALNGTGTLNVVPVGVSEDFTNYLSVHSASDGIVIPANFSSDYLAGKPVNVTVYGNPSSSSSVAVSATVKGVINAFNLKFYGGSQIIGMSQTTVSSQASDYFDFFIPGLIGFSIINTPMDSLVNISSEYKKTNLFKQLSLTPITKMEWLTSKILWFDLLNALSFLLMVAAGVFIFGAHISLTLWLLPFLVLGPMLFASLGMLVANVTKSAESASVVGNIISFPMMFLAGTFFPLSFMPTYLQYVARILPLFYIIDGLNGVMIYSNYAQVTIDIMVVAVITFIVFISAAKLFKWRED
jgi:ABC-2 type transport system permease protein